MTNQEAAHILREMYSGTRKGDVALQFLLFGIKYSPDLDRLNVSRNWRQPGCLRATARK